jgi:hypothetical protein
MGITSCVEIIDDITLKNDGSGVFKYTVNLSSSKIKIKSILALDSLDGKKVPKIEDIKEKISQFKSKLSSKQGIANVTIDSDFEDFVFKFRCDFSSVSTLQNAIKEVIEEMANEKMNVADYQEWLSWDGQKLVRSIPEITLEKTKNLKQEEIEQLKLGSYTSISRFERLVDRFENPEAKLSQNKLNVMVKTGAYSLIQNPNLLENTIYLTPLKN